MTLVDSVRQSLYSISNGALTSYSCASACLPTARLISAIDLTPMMPLRARFVVLGGLPISESAETLSVNRCNESAN